MKFIHKCFVLVLFLFISILGNVVSFVPIDYRIQHTYRNNVFNIQCNRGLSLSQWESFDFPSSATSSTTKLHDRQLMGDVDDDEISEKSRDDVGVVLDIQRRRMLKKNIVQTLSLLTGIAIVASLTRPVWAAIRSRTDGYQIQKTDDEWKQQLSSMQYFVLRQGGTERPGYSVLEKEKRRGTYVCAGCGTPLFESSSKFSSGTGWPSFARGLPGVEIEKVDFFTANLSGAELRCTTCGGHLGDVFNDGYLFIGSEAAKTGKRFCIDGAALTFYPDDADKNDPVRGDIPAKQQPETLPSIFDPPKVSTRSKEE